MQINLLNKTSWHFQEPRLSCNIQYPGFLVSLQVRLENVPKEEKMHGKFYADEIFGEVLNK